MRQVGVLAAAALVGLDTAPERLQKDHEHAKKLCKGWIFNDFERKISS